MKLRVSPRATACAAGRFEVTRRRGRISFVAGNARRHRPAHLKPAGRHISKR